MKYYMFLNKTNVKEYTLRMIEYLFLKAGIEMVKDPQEADIVMVSMCDVTEIKDIKKARELKKPILSGGMVSEYPIVNELSDFTYHGEIYGLIKHLKLKKSLESCKYITTKEDRKLNICETINWKENPIIRVGKRSAYYYCGKGCPVMCKYCFIGNVRKYQKLPLELYRVAERVIKKGNARMLPISAYNPYAASTERNITEVLIKEYVKKDGMGLKKSLIRSGVEFVTDKYSKNLAKGVTLDILNKAILISKRDRSRMILYFIAGLETQKEFEDFFSNIIIDYDMTPVITLVFTYLEAQPMTPLYDFDLRQRKVIDRAGIFYEVTQRNKRFRTIPIADIKKNTIRTLIIRSSSIQEYDFIRSLNRKSVTYKEVVKQVEEEYPHLLGSASIEDCMKRKRGLVKDGTISKYWLF